MLLYKDIIINLLSKMYNLQALEFDLELAIWQRIYWMSEMSAGRSHLDVININIYIQIYIFHIC